MESVSQFLAIFPRGLRLSVLNKNVNSAFLHKPQQMGAEGHLSPVCDDFPGVTLFRGEAIANGRRCERPLVPDSRAQERGMKGEYPFAIGGGAFGEERQGHPGMDDVGHLLRDPGNVGTDLAANKERSRPASQNAEYRPVDHLVF